MMRRRKAPAARPPAGQMRLFGAPDAAPALHQPAPLALLIAAGAIVPVHADTPAPVPVPVAPSAAANPFATPSNPANRLAWPDRPDGGCGKCGAPVQMRRRYTAAGMAIAVCIACGNDGRRRAGHGAPDACTATGCTSPRPCRHHPAPAPSLSELDGLDAGVAVCG